MGAIGRSLVLVGVLKKKRDLDILRRKRWYRMPLANAPKRSFDYIAFYQPASFGKYGKCIRYYARVSAIEKHKRRELLPKEADHPRAGETYYMVRIQQLLKRPPIKNRRFPARRVSFGFTTMRRLLSANNMLELYNVCPTEEIVARALRRARIPAIAQQHVAGLRRGKRVRYFLDFGIPCAGGKIAIECDNDKAHISTSQRLKDRAKDSFLRRSGWTIIRLTENEIIHTLPQCITRIERAIARLGGLSH